MMGVVVVKAAKNDFFGVRLIISIGIPQQNKIWCLRNVYTFGRKLKTYGHAQAVGKNGLLVGLAIIIGIFQNEQLIVRFGVSRFVGRIARHNACLLYTSD